LRELGDKVQHGVALERIGERQDGEPADLTKPEAAGTRSAPR
jgi:hypothetical protein